ncbi:MAG: GNAT family N-acetyltransferase [Bacteroidota bacterium]|jgi:N-acetylglutamate synthase-like GNAT family acetyltransferase
MTNIITIREYEPKDKHDVIDLIRLSTPDYFAAHEEKDFNRFLETERELFYVLPMDGKIAGCGGINFADNRTTGIISWDIIHPAHRGKSYDSFVVGSSEVLRLNFCAKNPPLRQAAKRYRKGYYICIQQKTNK